MRESVFLGLFHKTLSSEHNSKNAQKGFKYISDLIIRKNGGKNPEEGDVDFPREAADDCMVK